jgi:phytoene dehydrogenase-like protein
MSELSERYDCVVVGGGVAGLSAAAFVAKAGRSVLLLERNESTGGLVGTIDRGGFRFDAGLRAIEDAGIVRPLLRSLGLSLEFLPSPVSIGIEDRLIRLSGAGSLEDYRGLLAGLYPESAAEVDRVIAKLRETMGFMEVLYGAENPAFHDLARDREYLLKTLLPWTFKLLGTFRKMARMSGPVEAYLDRLASNQGLKDIIGQHFFRETPAFFALSYFSLYLDYLYPRGGTGELVRALEGCLKGEGAAIRTGSPVVALLPASRRVRTADGAEFGYRQLVWACDQKLLYSLVDSGELAALPGREGRRARRGVAERAALIADKGGGDSVFSLFLSVDRPPEDFAAVSSGHLFYTPERGGLGGQGTRGRDRLLESWPDFASPEARAAVLAWVERYLGLTTYEISIPALRDPGMAPPGKTGLIVSCLFDYEVCARADRARWHGELKEFVAARMIALLESRLYPGLSGKLLDRLALSPLSLERRVGNSGGALTGWSFLCRPMPAETRTARVARAVLTPLPGVSQAGMWSFSPSGMPISALTGKLAADRALEALGAGYSP